MMDPYGPPVFSISFPCPIENSGRAMVVTSCDWHDGQTIPVKVFFAADATDFLYVYGMFFQPRPRPVVSHGIHLEDTSILLSLMLRLSGRRDDTRFA